MQTVWKTVSSAKNEESHKEWPWDADHRVQDQVQPVLLRYYWEGFPQVISLVVGYTKRVNWSELHCTLIHCAILRCTVLHFIGTHEAILHSISVWEMKYWDLTLAILTPSKGYISQYTPWGVYGLVVNEIYEGIFSLMFVKMIYCPYKGSTRDIRSNIPLCLQEFPRAPPSGTPSGEGVYLTVYLVLIRMQD